MPDQSTPSDLMAAYRQCEKLAASHYENFPVASFLLPRDKQRYIAAIYAFARTADDFADEPGMEPAERIDKLREWEEELTVCYAGTPHKPIFVALQDTIRRFEIPQDLLQRLLEAFKSDVTLHRHETFENLLRYCKDSANPVGRLVLWLFGYRDEQLAELSDNICTGLQLANFWQDVTVDLDKDRVYLPLEDMRRFGVSEQNFFSRTFTPAFRSLMQFQVERTREFFEKGSPLLHRVGKDLKMELTLTVRGGLEIIRKIEKANYNVLGKRPTLSSTDKFLLLIRSFLVSRF